MNDISSLLKPQNKVRKEYTLEELGLVEDIGPSKFLEQFYRRNGVDYALPLEELSLEKYKIISSLVHIPVWNYFSQSRPPLCMLESQLLKENGYDL